MPQRKSAKKSAPKLKFRSKIYGPGEASEFNKPFSDHFAPLAEKYEGWWRLSGEWGNKMLTIDLSVVDDRNQEIGRFKFRTLPGCSTIIVSYDTWVHENYRKKGFATFFHEFKSFIAEKWGASLFMATIVDTNDVEKKMVEKRGWRSVSGFTNKKTGNKVSIWVKDL